MPTSPTELPAPRGESGFTLLELLVVLTIVGLFSAAVLLTAPSGGASLREEAERLAARASAAQEQAVLGNRTIVLRVTGAGYAFSERHGDGWRPATSPPGGRWEPGVAAERPARILFDATGVAEPAEVMLGRGGERLAVEIASDGEIRVRRPS